MPETPSQYRGRFAPSPTGPLHFGSLVSAVASYADARHVNGQWLVRIEDIDPAREIPGSDKSILNTLELFGFEWDEEVVWQSKRQPLYQEAIHQLISDHHVYYCSCTRKSIIAAGLQGANGMLYPGHCQNKNLTESSGHSLRLRVTNQAIHFTDRVRGQQCQHLDKDVGDFILRRSDQLWAYQLAVVVDDAEQNINHIVRGTDLLHSTQRQIYLQQCLSYSQPEYLHHLLIFNNSQTKLSKQTGAPALQTDKPHHSLFNCLQILGQQPPTELQHATLNEIWQWAISHWNVSALIH
ncbi:Glutamyl-Q tRNA(Asp) synthetase [hydrothermal vent metagenome]|uniref:Glutamyl-Q tRNA(Asp) synthetase n=1 Tax=hydrothermal vent metagenome TaxID=652676 RepID=A0A3B0XS88_9ZZZZ